MMTKELNTLSLNISEEDYRALDAYSYSKLSTFIKTGFSKIKYLDEKKESKSLIFGSVLDTLMTEGEEAFQRKFLVYDEPVVSSTIYNIVWNIFKDYSSQYIKLEQIPMESVIPYLSNYYTNRKEETRYLTLLKEGATLYDYFWLSLDKKVIDVAMYEEACKSMQTLKESNVTRYYFAKDDPFDNVKRYYQLKFTGEFDNIPIKCMLDLILVDYTNKTIQLCDLKTTHNDEYKFYESFLKFNYYIQAQLYTEIIKQNLEKDSFFKDFRILPFKFIVINPEELNPLIWEYDDNFCITSKMYGKNSQIKCLSWREVLKELDYYIKCSPQYPLNINPINSITEWLNKQ